MPHVLSVDVPSDGDFRRMIDQVQPPPDHIVRVLYSLHIASTAVSILGTRLGAVAKCQRRWVSRNSETEDGTFYIAGERENAGSGIEKSKCFRLKLSNLIA